MRKSLQFLVLSTSFSLTACMANQPVSIAAVHESDVCNLDRAGIYQWSAVENDFYRYRSLELPLVPDGAQRIVVSMGQFRTGGYSLELIQDELDISEETAVVPVNLIRPSSSDAVAQMLTDPCLILDVYATHPLEYQLPESD